MRMAVLRFSYGTMGSGKSTLALQIHHNLSSRGLRGLLCTQLDRDGAVVSSRLGVSAAGRRRRSEARPLRARLAATPRPTVASTTWCATRRSSTRRPRSSSSAGWSTSSTPTCTRSGCSPTSAGKLFEGSARFLELADERQELQVEARCWCGARATQNARLVNGKQVYDGEVVVVGDTGGDAEVTYELLCRRHWLRGETGRVDEAAAAALVDDATLSD